MARSKAAAAVLDEIRGSVQEIKAWDELPLFLDVKMTAELLGVGEGAVRNLCRTKNFPARMYGNSYLISRDGLRSWAEGEDRWGEGVSFWQWQKVIQNLNKIEELIENNTFRVRRYMKG